MSYYNYVCVCSSASSYLSFVNYAGVADNCKPSELEARIRPTSQYKHSLIALFAIGANLDNFGSPSPLPIRHCR